MNEKAHIPNIFKDLTDTMLRYFKGWEQDLPHQGEKGGIRERRVVDLLSKYLPKRYGIGTGHIIDSKGGMSNQTDIVIYDAFNGMALPIDNDYSLFPIECVYAAIEVKSKLTASNAQREEDRGEIYKCIKSTTRLKSLSRNHDLPSVPSLVFAYTTAWEQDQWKRVAEHFYFLGKNYDQKIPDVVLVLDAPGFVLCTYKSDKGPDKDRFSHLFQKNPLLFFISDLIARLSRTKVAMPNLWEEYGDWLQGDTIATIIPTTSYPEINKAK